MGGRQASLSTAALELELGPAQVQVLAQCVWGAFGRCLRALSYFPEVSRFLYLRLDLKSVLAFIIFHFIFFCFIIAILFACVISHLSRFFLFTSLFLLLCPYHTILVISSFHWLRFLYLLNFRSVSFFARIFYSH